MANYDEIPQVNQLNDLVSRLFAVSVVSEQSQVARLHCYSAHQPGIQQVYALTTQPQDDSFHWAPEGSVLLKEVFYGQLTVALEKFQLYLNEQLNQNKTACVTETNLKDLWIASQRCS